MRLGSSIIVEITSALLFNELKRSEAGIIEERKYLRFMMKQDKKYHCDFFNH